MVGVGKYAVPLINLLIGVYTFTTGLHVDQVWYNICWNGQTEVIILTFLVGDFLQQHWCEGPGQDFHV